MDDVTHAALRRDIGRRLQTLDADDVHLIDQLLLRVELGMIDRKGLGIPQHDELDAALECARSSIRERESRLADLYEAAAAERLVELYGEAGRVYPLPELATSRTPTERFDFDTSDLEDTIPGCEMGGEA